MAVVWAKGRTEYYGEQSIAIYGDKYVERIECSRKSFAAIVRESIEKAKGWIANGYHPPANTMLQADATLRCLFDSYYDVHIEGDIGKIPYDPDPNIDY